MKNLRKNFIVVLLLCVWGFSSPSQTTTDSIPAKKKFDNYYCLFHETIKETKYKTVSRFGHYLYLGLGPGLENKLIGYGLHIGYSLAYKSHILSLTHVYVYSLKTENDTVNGEYSASNNIIMFGESIRLRNFILALSTGIAFSEIYLIDDGLHFYSVFDKKYISIPFELKVFFLADKVIGGGLIISTAIISKKEYSPFYAGLSLVLGHWNYGIKTPRRNKNMWWPEEE